MNRLVRDVLGRCADGARRRGVAIEADIADARLMVLANAFQIGQVVTNLIDNAVDAIDAAPDGPRILRVTCSSHPDRAQVSVEDTGAGLDPSVADRMFEPFFSTKPRGMGMGLMFCRSVVEAHGGHLRAAANTPRGAVLSFALPRT